MARWRRALLSEIHIEHLLYSEMIFLPGLDSIHMNIYVDSPLNRITVW